MAEWITVITACVIAWAAKRSAAKLKRRALDPSSTMASPVFHRNYLLSYKLVEDVLYAPMYEELLFRIPVLLLAEEYGIVRGLLAGLAINLGFAWLHCRDERHRLLPNWRLRAICSTVLGLVCLGAGLASGSLIAPIAVHAAWNLTLNYPAYTGRISVIRFYYGGLVVWVRMRGWNIFPPSLKPNKSG